MREDQRTRCYGNNLEPRSNWGEGVPTNSANISATSLVLTLHSPRSASDRPLFWGQPPGSYYFRLAFGGKKDFSLLK